MTGDDQLPVVAGVDCAPGGLTVEWAAAEAYARGRPLRLVHVVQPPFSLDVGPYADALGPIPLGAFYRGGDRLSNHEKTHRQATDLLRTALRQARAIAPDLAVSACVLAGAAGRRLVAESHRAALLVVGSRGHRHTGWAGHRSVTARLVRGVRCPIVFVPPLRRDQPTTPPRIVVAANQRPADTAALEFAFNAAAQRDIPLVALLGASAARLPRARTADMPRDGDPRPYGVLESLRAVYPSVCCVSKPMPERIEHARHALTNGCSLLVLPAPPSGIRHARHSAQQIRTLLAGSTSPVAFVPHQSRAGA